ncbi:MAG: adenylyltransferase/cytidyltransferase family protein [Actinomycetota bacterium]|nr:adenylyltransferase/cytidyltransferase family protein [Actinomycetota bacterium]
MAFDNEIEELRRSAQPRLLVAPDPGPVRSAALLSGSFDPLTVAHAALAERAAELVDAVVLVYAVDTLPKEGGAAPPLLPVAERLEVLRRYCRPAERRFVGLASHGLLADQAEAAAERFPGAELWLVVGSDKVLQLFDPRWYEDREAALDRLFSRAGVLHAERERTEGAVPVRDVMDRLENRRWRDRVRLIDVPPGIAGVSSRMVRELVRRGEDVAALLPPEARESVARAVRSERERPG